MRLAHFNSRNKNIISVAVNHGGYLVERHAKERISLYRLSRKKDL